MKGKQLALLLLLVAVLGGAWYLLSDRHRTAWSDSGGGGGKVVEFPINDVSRLVIKDTTSTVNLVKAADGWTVQERANYPASFELVGGLLRKLWDLKTVQEVKIGASQLPRLELIEPGKGEKSGTLVEFVAQDGKVLAALLLGKKSLRKSDGGQMDFGGDGFPNGRYVKSIAAPKVSLVSDALDDVEAKPERWLLKDFVKVEDPKLVSLAGLAETQRWTLTRQTGGEWQLADAKPEEKLDPAKTSPLNNILSMPSFNDVLAPDAKPEETGLDKPVVATIETFDGFRYELKIGKATEEAYPVLIAVSANLAPERAPGKDEKPEDKTRLDNEFKAKQKQLEEKLAKEKKFEGRPYLVAKYSIEPLLKDRASFQPDKPATPPAPAPGAPTPPVTTPEPAPGAATPPPAPSVPSATPAPAGVSVTTAPVGLPSGTLAPKIEAVTPPIETPALPGTNLPPSKPPAEIPIPPPAAPTASPSEPTTPRPTPVPPPLAPPVSDPETPAPEAPTPTPQP